jgi:quercetin dioxygenase-like cupin family protein
MSVCGLLIGAWVLNGPASAQVPGNCATPAAERTGELGCYVDAEVTLGDLPKSPVFWHLYNYPDRAAAEAVKAPHGAVVEAFGKVWLYVIADQKWHPSTGTKVAVVGPLKTVAGKQYSARYMEAALNSGMHARVHLHSGPEAFYLVTGAQCLETTHGTTITKAGDSAIAAEGDLMTVQSVGNEVRRAVVLVLHDVSQPWQTLSSDWTPKGSCPN